MNESVHDERPPAEKLNAADLPRVAVFLDGFLNDDAAREHGSAAGAAYDYVAGAELDELEELASEWSVVVAAARTMPVETLQKALQSGFASSWRPTSLGEVEAVGAELEAALEE